MSRIRYYFNLRLGPELVACYTFLDQSPDIEVAYARALADVLNPPSYARPLPEWDTLAIWRVGASKKGHKP